MWQFRSKQTERDLEILKIFYIYQERLTVHQLAERLDCDIKTVRTRLLEINNTYDLPKIVYNYETDSVRAAYEPSFWPFMIYQEFYKNNLEFQVLEYLFIKTHITTYKLLDEFAISDSTLLRIINNLNANLSRWDIKIESKSYRIVGDELAITKFFSQYFIEKMSTDYFEDFETFQVAVFNIFIDIIKSTDFYELRTYYMRFQWYTFVSLIRNSKGHFVKSNHVVTEEEMLKRIEVLNEQDLKTIESLFGVSLSDPVVTYDVFYFYVNHFEAIRFKKYTYSYETVEALVEEIKEEFNLELSEKGQQRGVQVLYENINHHFVQNYFLFNRSQYEVDRLRKLFPDTIETLYAIFTGFMKETTGVVDEALVAHLILFLYNIYPNFYEKMKAYEAKLEVNCMFVANVEAVVRTMKFLQDNYSFMANFTLHYNDELPGAEKINEELWIVDIQALSSPNTLVINTNLLPMQSALIFDFLSMKMEATRE